MNFQDLDKLSLLKYLPADQAIQVVTLYYLDHKINYILFVAFLNLPQQLAIIHLFYNFHQILVSISLYDIPKNNRTIALLPAIIQYFMSQLFGNTDGSLQIKQLKHIIFGHVVDKT